MSSKARTGVLTPSPASTATLLASSAGWRAVWDLRETVTERKSLDDLVAECTVETEFNLHLFRWLSGFAVVSWIAGAGTLRVKQLYPAAFQALPIGDIYHGIDNSLVPGVLAAIGHVPL